MENVTRATVAQMYAGMSNAGNQITREIQEMWDSAVAAFYSAYSPRQYMRTGNTYNASDKGANNFCTVSGTKVTVRCGILVDSSFMDDVYINDDVSTVFSNTYTGGIHGNSWIAVTTPPQSIFEPWFFSMIGSFVSRILTSF